MATLYKFGSATPEDWTKEHTNRNPKRVDDRWEALGADYDETNNRVIFCAPHGYWGNTNNTGTLVTLDQDNNNISLDIDTEATTADGINISAAVMTVGTVLDIPDLDLLSTGKAINVVSNSPATGTRSLAYIKNDHTSATGATVLELVQDAAFRGVFIDHNGATGSALFIDGEQTTETAGILDVSAAVLTTGTGLDIGDLDLLSTGIGVNIVSNSPATGTRSLAYIKNDHTSATGTTVLELVQDAASIPFAIAMNANAAAMKVSGSGAYAQTTVGASGSATAVPSNPTYYLLVNVSGLAGAIPVFAAS